MTSPPLPRNLDHLKNGRRVWFYGTHPSTQPLWGTVVGRSRDPQTGLVSLTIAPDGHEFAVRTEIKGGVVRRTINAVFPDLDSLNAHHAWLETATVDEISKWTGDMISLYNLISADPKDAKY